MPMEDVQKCSKYDSESCFIPTGSNGAKTEVASKAEGVSELDKSLLVIYEGRS